MKRSFHLYIHLINFSCIYWKTRHCGWTVTECFVHDFCQVLKTFAVKRNTFLVSSLSHSPGQFSLLLSCSWPHSFQQMTCFYFTEKSSLVKNYSASFRETQQLTPSTPIFTSFLSSFQCSQHTQSHIIPHVLTMACFFLILAPIFTTSPSLFTSLCHWCKHAWVFILSSFTLYSHLPILFIFISLFLTHSAEATSYFAYPPFHWKCILQLSVTGWSPNPTGTFQFLSSLTFLAFYTAGSAPLPRCPTPCPPWLYLLNAPSHPSTVKFSRSLTPLLVFSLYTHFL